MMTTEDRDTIPKLVRRNYDRWAQRTAMRIKKSEAWRQYSWRKYYENVKYCSLGLVSLGLERGDVVCIIGDNEPEWFWAEFATQAAGGIATGILVDSVFSEAKYIAEHSDAKFAIVKGQEQAGKFLEIKDGLPAVEKIIYWDAPGLEGGEHPALIGFTEVVRMGREYEESHPGLFEENVEEGSGDDTACIYYISETPGLPRGARLSHRALISAAAGFINRHPTDETDDLVSDFPAAWAGSSFFTTMPHLLTGACLMFSGRPETVTEATRESAPGFVTDGPRRWEGLASEVQKKMTDAHPLRRLVYKWFLAVGHRIADFGLQGKSPNILWRALYRMANLFLFRPLKEKLGLSKVRFVVTGSSGLSLDTLRLIRAIGIEPRQVYASTEAGLIACHARGETDFGSAGRPAVNAEVRVSDGGELLVRSQSMFDGYLKDPERTAAVLIDGWYHTGDGVSINDTGHLVLLGRLDRRGELRSDIK